MSELLNKLDKIIDDKEEDTILLSVVESIALLLSGIFLTYGANQDKNGFVAAGITTMIGFIILKVKSLSKSKSAGKEIVNHLITKEDYDILKTKYKRRLKLDEYIDNSIIEQHNLSNYK